LTAGAIVKKIEPALAKFGQKVFCAAVPDEFVTDIALIQ
jgi:hypothetical protein